MKFDTAKKIAAPILVMVLLFVLNIQKADAIISYAVGTSAATSITKTSAILNGSMIISGGVSASEHGFGYGTDSTLDTVIATTTLGAEIFSGPFSQTVSLSCGTTYYFIAYAISNTSVYKAGTILNFTTAACEGGGGTLYNNGMTGGPSQIPAATNIAYVNGYPIVLAGSTTTAATSTAATSSTVALVATPTATSTPAATSSVSALYVPVAQAPVTADSKLGFFKDLSFGLTDTDVLRLQQFLNAHGFVLSSQGSGSPGKETTFFGLATKAALVRFQKANNIYPAIGFFGPITRGVVNGLK